MQFRARDDAPAPYPLMQQRVRQEVAAYLLRRRDLGLEDKREGIGLLMAKVQRAGDLESVPDLALQGDGGHLDTLAKVCGKLEVS